MLSVVRELAPYAYVNQSSPLRKRKVVASHLRPAAQVEYKPYKDSALECTGGNELDRMREKKCIEPQIASRPPRGVQIPIKEVVHDQEKLSA